MMTFGKNPKLDSGDATETDRLTAYQIVNEWDEENIADIIYAYGEERYSRKIAAKIVEARAHKPIATTFELVEVIRKAVPFFYANEKVRKTHFATKTFQALRITVNDEVQALKEALQKGFAALKSGSDAKSGGRMAVISFHSIEDRIVKRYFQEVRSAGRASVLTKKPIVPSEQEISENRRSRSAKLRILEKIS